MVTSSRQSVGNGIQAIANGKLLVANYMGSASFFDLKTGNLAITVDGPAESLLWNRARGCVIFSMPQFTRVSQYSLADKSTAVVPQLGMF